MSDNTPDHFHDMSGPAFESFLLPNGSKLKNRIVKAAMEEGLADIDHGNQPSKSLVRLFKAWGDGGAGLIISGHTMIDPHAMAAADSLLLAHDCIGQDYQVWRRWTDCTQSNGAQFWLQLNHPGKVMKTALGLQSYAPSAIPLEMGRLSSMFIPPLAMTEEHILDVIERFTWSAVKAEELGFSGVEIHAAHGYLISQFLSPKSNHRADRWGGSLETRALLLFRIVYSIRSSVSSSFGVGVKINSADFQRGGFDSDDLSWVVKQLNSMGLDFIELTGGNMESPAMLGDKQIIAKAKEQYKKSASTIAREAHFIEAAEELKAIAQMPIIVTGGIRSKAVVDAVLASSPNLLAGLATALGLMPDLPDRWARGEEPEVGTSESWILPGMMKYAANNAAVRWNLHRTGRGDQIWMGVWPVYAMIVAMIRDLRANKKAKQGWIGEMIQKDAVR